MRLATALSLLLSPGLASAGSAQTLDLVGHPVGTAALVIFTLAYLAVIAEEFTKLRKSKPVILAAGLIWALIGAAYHSQGISDTAAAALRHNLLKYAELLLFLLAAMTYINAMEERHVFEALRGWLVRRSLSYRALFWATGTLAFFISPFADNLTTALIMCAVLMAVGGHSHRFITLGCINIVVAANAGGAFSPFGDITTLMVILYATGHVILLGKETKTGPIALTGQGSLPILASSFERRPDCNPAFAVPKVPFLL